MTQEGAGGGAGVQGGGRRLLLRTMAAHRRGVILSGAAVLGGTAAKVAVPYLLKRAIDDGVVPGDLSALWKWVTVLSTAVVAAAAFQWITQRTAGRVAESMMYDVRLRVWRHLQSLSLDYFEERPRGDVIARVSSDVDALQTVFATAAPLFTANVVLIVSVGVLMVVLNPLLAGVVAIVMPFVAATGWLFKVRSERAYRRLRDQTAEVTARVAETLSGMRVVQAFGREPLNQAVFDDANRRHLDANAGTVTLASAYAFALELLGYVAVFLVLVVGGSRAIRGEITVGVLSAFVIYVQQFFQPLEDLSQLHNSVSAAIAGLERIAAVLATRPSVAEPAEARPLVVTAGEVRLERVSFGYREGLVLHDVDLTVPGGQTVALVGPTGAGKSSIAKLMVRFYDPSSGRVVVDGQDLREVRLDSLRRAVVLVTQEPFLFSGSIHENVALGRPDTSRAQVEEAARAVGAHDLVSALPDGYDTQVDQRGVRLSGGQRQLISLARALVADPRVLVVDEATSGLDPAAERLVHQAMKRLLAGRTAILIAHRLSMTELADEVAVIEDGRIVEHGRRSELMATNSRLRRLHRRWEARLH